jgi:hypothetical protein
MKPDAAPKMNCLREMDMLNLRFVSRKPTSIWVTRIVARKATSLVRGNHLAQVGRLAER